MPGIEGIDVSHYQNQAGGGGPNAINWAAVRAAGVKFVFVKISEQTSADSFAQQNVARARAAGLLVGGYHFLRNSASGQAQANAFLNTVQFQQGDLLPALDLEVVPGSAAAKTAYVQKARSWVSRIAQHYGKPPFLYTRRDILVSLGNPSGLQHCPLWLARFGSAPPPLPAGWPSFVIWQFSQSGSVNGVTGNVDLDDAAVPFAQLRAQYTI